MELAGQSAEAVEAEQRHRSARLRSVAGWLGAFAGALGLTGLLFLVLGANPLDAYAVMLRGALGSSYSIGGTLTITMVFTLTGLAAAIPFSARLWNVGGDGQLYAGAIAAVVVALSLGPEPALPVIVLALVLAVVAGGVWSLIAGILRAFLGINEVIVTVMLNFIAVLIANYVIEAFKGEGIQESTRPIPTALALPPLWPGASVSIGLVFALVAVGLAFVLVRHTPMGLGIRAAGSNAPAARLAGFNLRYITLAVFAAGGGCAGLVGGLLVMGTHHALVFNMSNNYGLMGVAVALLARLEPLWILPAGLFFAIVTVGGNSLTAALGISTSASLLMVATFPILLIAFRVIRLRYPQV
jgi:general nucleoside transport system permease protein